VSIINTFGVRKAVADVAARRVRRASAGLPARIIGDEVNEFFASEPGTSAWVVTRREIEVVLSADARFECSDGLWRLSASTPEHPDDDAFAVAVSAVQHGTSLVLRPWQNAALNAWIAAGRRGIVQAVTGSGKTWVGVGAIAEHLSVATARVVVLVPTIELQTQWIRTLRGVFSVPVGAVGDGHLDRFSDNVILVYVARSAADTLSLTVRRSAQRYAVLLVADECHRYGSTTYAGALDAPFSATLGLSATPERDGDHGMATYVLPRLGDVVYEYDHEQGVSQAVIADFRLCFVGVEFEAFEQAASNELTAQIARARRALVNEFPFLEHAAQFIHAVKQLAGRDEHGISRRYLQLTAERRRLLYGASARHDFVFWLAEQSALRDRKLLLFHETIADCEYLARGLTEAGIAAGAHHSGLHRETRRTTLARFARGELSAIVAPRTLDEGIDVPDASLAIIVAGTRVKRQAIQRIGRVLRVSPGKQIALVLKVFVRDGADDPTIPTADKFSKELIASNRSIVASWPHHKHDVLKFLE
jgi:RNA polymerase primary sigma factor